MSSKHRSIDKVKCIICTEKKHEIYDVPNVLLQQWQKMLGRKVTKINLEKLQICVKCSFFVNLLVKFLNSGICVSYNIPKCFMCKISCVVDIEKTVLTNYLENSFKDDFEKDANYFTCAACFYQLKLSTLWKDKLIKLIEPLSTNIDNKTAKYRIKSPVNNSYRAIITRRFSNIISEEKTNISVLLDKLNIDLYELPKSFIKDYSIIINSTVDENIKLIKNDKMLNNEEINTFKDNKNKQTTAEKEKGSDDSKIDDDKLENEDIFADGSDEKKNKSTTDEKQNNKDENETNYSSQEEKLVISDTESEQTEVNLSILGKNDLFDENICDDKSKWLENDRELEIKNNEKKEELISTKRTGINDCLSLDWNGDDDSNLQIPEKEKINNSTECNSFTDKDSINLKSPVTIKNKIKSIKRRRESIIDYNKSYGDDDSNLQIPEKEKINNSTAESNSFTDKDSINLKSPVIIKNKIKSIKRRRESIIDYNKSSKIKINKKQKTEDYEKTNETEKNDKIDTESIQNNIAKIVDDEITSNSSRISMEKILSDQSENDDKVQDKLFQKNTDEAVDLKEDVETNDLKKKKESNTKANDESKNITSNISTDNSNDKNYKKSNTHFENEILDKNNVNVLLDDVDMPTITPKKDKNVSFFVKKIISNQNLSCNDAEEKDSRISDDEDEENDKEDNVEEKIDNLNNKKLDESTSLELEDNMGSHIKDMFSLIDPKSNYLM